MLGWQCGVHGAGFRVQRQRGVQGVGCRVYGVAESGAGCSRLRLWEEERRCLLVVWWSVLPPATTVSPLGH